MAILQAASMAAPIAMTTGNTNKAGTHGPRQFRLCAGHRMLRDALFLRTTLSMKNQLTCSLIFLLLLAVAMSATQSPKSQSSTNKNSVHKPKMDPCTLLTSGDIQAVQAEAVQETKPSAQQAGGLLMSQCVFRTGAPSKSVSVALASAGSTSPRAFWTRQFHSGKTEPNADEHSRHSPIKTSSPSKEQEEESSRPRPIPGVGDEAYWVGGSLVGALYVLKRDTFIRISVGGIRQEPLRIQKSIALARAALKRL